MSETRARLQIGVLAIQGAFFEHRAALLKAAKSSTFSKSIEVEVSDVREPHQLSDLDGLILPGGESTTMSLFLQSSNFEDVLKEWVASKEKPKVVWGTCAGLILLSNDIEAQKEGGQSKVETSPREGCTSGGGGLLDPCLCLEVPPRKPTLCSTTSKDTNSNSITCPKYDLMLTDDLLKTS